MEKWSSAQPGHAGPRDVNRIAELDLLPDVAHAQASFNLNLLSFIIGEKLSSYLLKHCFVLGHHPIITAVIYDRKLVSVQTKHMAEGAHPSSDADFVSSASFELLL